MFQLEMKPCKQDTLDIFAGFLFGDNDIQFWDIAVVLGEDVNLRVIDHFGNPGTDPFSVDWEEQGSKSRGWYHRSQSYQIEEDYGGYYRGYFEVEMIRDLSTD